MAIAAEDFDFISSIARSSAAIVLEKGKEYLVEARLGPVAHNEGYSSLPELIGALRGSTSSPLHDRVVEALTTNETFFFRDFHPFEAMRKAILPELLEKRAEYKSLRIWSAASSTGQEAYSIAMLLKEHFPQLSGWRIEIIGTDLSPSVLARATAGTYSQIEVNRGLPVSYLIKYFTKNTDTWTIKPEIRQMVTFRPMNLIQPWPCMAPFDLVLMRNVMIYFDVATKRTILHRLRSYIQPHGYLILGASETTMNLDSNYKLHLREKTSLFGTIPIQPTTA